MANSDDIDDLREQKLRELRERARQQQSEGPSEQESQSEETSAILKQVTTEDARRRLNTVRMTHEDRVEAIETKIVRLAQQGQIQERIDDDQMRELLKKVSEKDSTDFDIRRR